MCNWARWLVEGYYMGLISNSGELAARRWAYFTPEVKRVKGYISMKAWWHTFLPCRSRTTFPEELNIKKADVFDMLLFHPSTQMQSSAMSIVMLARDILERIKESGRGSLREPGTTEVVWFWNGVVIGYGTILKPPQQRLHADINTFAFHAAIIYFFVLIP